MASPVVIFTATVTSNIHFSCTFCKSSYTPITLDTLICVVFIFNSCMHYNILTVGISSEHPVNSGPSNHCGNALDDDQYNFEHNDPSIFIDPTYQCIRFQDFQANSWHTICDRNLTEL